MHVVICIFITALLSYYVSIGIYIYLPLLSKIRFCVTFYLPVKSVKVFCIYLPVLVPLSICMLLLVCPSTFTETPGSNVTLTLKINLVLSVISRTTVIVKLLSEKCANTEFFCSVFSCIQSEYRKIRTRKNSTFGHFSSSNYCRRFRVVCVSVYRFANIFEKHEFHTTLVLCNLFHL